MRLRAECFLLQYLSHICATRWRNNYIPSWTNYCPCLAKKLPTKVIERLLGSALVKRWTEEIRVHFNIGKALVIP